MEISHHQQNIYVLIHSYSIFFFSVTCLISLWIENQSKPGYKFTIIGSKRLDIFKDE